MIEILFKGILISIYVGAYIHEIFQYRRLSALNEPGQWTSLFNLTFGLLIGVMIIGVLIFI